MAVSFLNRVNTSFYILAEARRNLDSFSFFNELLILRAEFCDDMTPKEIEISNSYKKRLHPMIQSELKKNKGNGYQISQELYDELDDFEMFLRQIYKSAGYKSKFKDDPRFALK